MSNGTFAMWIGLMFLGFVGSALYSGMETGCYCLNRIRLHIRTTQDDRAAHRLTYLLARPNVLLSTLLIGNNITNYLGTASLAVILSASGLSQTQQIILNTVLVTPVLFVFGETLPKDLFTAHADRLMYPLQPLLTGSRRLYTALLLVPIVGLFAGALMRVLGQQAAGRAFHPRRQVGELVKEGVGYGLLSDSQSRIVERSLALRGRTVGAEMTPWAQVRWVRVNDSAERVRGLAATTRRARFPVIDAKGMPLGVVNVFDVLVQDAAQAPPLKDLVEQVPLLKSSTPLRRGLAELQRAGTHIAIVVDDAGKAVGVVTPKDLIEPVTGELPGW